TVQRLGRWLVIKDATGAIPVYTSQTTRLEPGDRLDVVGFPLQTGRDVSLQDATFRKLGTGPPPVPVPITAPQALAGGFDHALVELDAELIEAGPLSPRTRGYLFKAGDQLFEASLRMADQGENWTVPEPGSRVRVTGVCRVWPGETGTEPRLRLWMRSGRDLSVLSRPSRWTMVRLIWLLGLAGVAGLAALAWIWVMRHRVKALRREFRQREAGLQRRYQELFDTANGILFTIDLKGRFTSLNPAAATTLACPREDVLKMNLADFVPLEKRDTVSALIQHTRTGQAGSHQQLELIAHDGRRLALAVEARLECVGGSADGLRVLARDITEQKQAEEALRFSEQQLLRSLEEQGRIARDLHDGVIQSVYAVGLALEDCRQLISQDPAQAETRLAKCRTDLNGLIRDLRSFIGGLEPEAIRGRELQAALKSLVLTMGETHSARFALHVDPLAADRLNPKQATHVLHIAREAMSNSLRHAAAQTTIVSLQLRDGGMRLEVKDDGIGFEVKNVSASGHGLRNIAARASELQARLEIVSHPGHGTRVIVDLPHLPTA
ncbi:MAG: PAS domain-containing sensor histidine kinase, partial [Verrucomicrobia bacterium]|nr:PAS domain-containing sensor histidine kinase [Verrucomicrobiota bacterium]